MSKSLPLLALVAAAASTQAMGAPASAPARYQGLLRRAIYVSEPGASFSRSGFADRPSYNPASVPRDSDFPRTAVDYRLTSDGLTGSVGYLSVDELRRVDVQQAVSSVATRFDRKSGFLGATFSYPFK